MFESRLSRCQYLKKRREKQKWICNLYSVKFMRSTLIYPRLWIHMEAKFYIHFILVFAARSTLNSQCVASSGKCGYDMKAVWRLKNLVTFRFLAPVVFSLLSRKHSRVVMCAANEHVYSWGRTHGEKIMKNRSEKTFFHSSSKRLNVDYADDCVNYRVFSFAGLWVDTFVVHFSP